MTLSDPATQWGALFVVWIAICVPAFLKAAFAGAPYLEDPVVEARLTRQGLWWSGGLVLLIGSWKIGGTPILGTLLLGAYALLTLGFFYVRRAKR